MHPILKKLARADSGTATLELALVMPIFASLLIGVVDFTTAFNRKLEMEQAVQRAIERVMQTTTTQTVEANIKAEAATAAGIPVENVTVVYTQTCNGVSTATTEDCPDGETQVLYTNVSAWTTFTPMFPLARLGLTSSAFTLNVETGIRTK
jgi:Flp pilus assembly protein TadG